MLAVRRQQKPLHCIGLTVSVYVRVPMVLTVVVGTRSQVVRGVPLLYGIRMQIFPQPGHVLARFSAD